MDNQTTQLQDKTTNVPKSKEEVGRPTVITERIVLKLEALLQQGHSVTKACEITRIGRTTYYQHYNNDEEFQNRMTEAENLGIILAGEGTLDVLLDVQRGREPMKDKDGKILLNKYGKPIYPYKYSEKNRLDMIRWYRERKESDEFGNKPATMIGIQNNNISVGLRNVKDRMLARIEAEKRKATEAEVVT